MTNEYLVTLDKGATVVHHIREPSDVIHLSNNTTFSKVLQVQYPKLPEVFIGDKDQQTDTIRFVKGHKRWLSLPVRAPVSN